MHLQKRSAHIDFNFPPRDGTGIAKLIPHVGGDSLNLIEQLLAYNPDERLSARQALKHPYFKELRDAEKARKAMLAAPEPIGTAGTDSSSIATGRSASTTAATGKNGTMGGVNKNGRMQSDAGNGDMSDDANDDAASGGLPAIGRKPGAGNKGNDLTASTGRGKLKLANAAAAAATQRTSQQQQQQQQQQLTHAGSIGRLRHAAANGAPAAKAATGGGSKYLSPVHLRQMAETGR
ncbi:hypothetical protein FOA52_012951 [Chlamydomonas sp. UWO 241]|nr:hypothetical protein FOA52_012951 [Chlamydomonas sp. UWO 241]